MTVKQYINNQFGNPRGTFGRIVGWALSAKNRERTQWAVEQLDVKPADKILEVGFGPGRAVKLISQKLTTGIITGIDRSEVMLKQGIKYNIDNIKLGKVSLLLCPVQNIQFPENSFDKVFAVNVHFFWKEQLEEFSKLKKILKKNGRLYVIFQPRWARSEEEVEKISEKTVLLFREAGFDNVKTNFKKMRPVTCISISGENSNDG